MSRLRVLAFPRPLRRVFSPSSCLLGWGHIGNNILVPISHEGTHWSKKVEVEVEVKVEIRVTACPRFRKSLPLGLVTRRDKRITSPEFDVNNGNGWQWIHRTHR